jgi:hypothetical protein
VLQQFADAENMIRITDRHATMHVIGAHDHPNPFGRLRGIGTLGFGNQVGVRNSAVHQVIVTDPAFVVSWVRGSPAAGDNHRSDASLKQLEGVVEAGTVHGRRTPGILRSAEDHDGIRGIEFLPRSLVYDSPTNRSQPNDRDRCGQCRWP